MLQILATAVNSFNVVFHILINCLSFIFMLKTAALAQKNSEATRTLAMQEEVLEKELGEIQKVLLAMQVSSTNWFLLDHV